MADIFISYSSEDRTAVTRLVDSLTESGFSVWYDHHLEGGSVFSREIEKELEAAKVVVAVWTKASLNSPWVADEAVVGRDSGKLLPISFDGSVPPIGFRQYQAIRFDQWNGTLAHDAFHRLLQSIERLMPRDPGGDDVRRNTGAGGHGPDAIVEKSPLTSIAVLAFTNMSGDPDNEYFSDGITEEIIAALTQLSDLRVTSRTSSFAFKNSDLELPAIARALGVGHVLEGSVRKAGEVIRITVQLIRASDDSHMWSETYERKLTEIFRIQEEISKSVAKALSVRLLGRPTEPARDVDPVAYDYYLQGRAFLENTVFADIDRAIDAFRRASTLDPGLTGAFAGEARAISFSVSTGKESPVPNLALAERAAFRALDGDARNADAEAALGLIEFVRRNLRACLDRYARAEQGHGLQELDYWFFAYALCDAGRFAEAESMLLRNLERNPLSAGIHIGLGQTFAALGRVQEAFHCFTQAVELEPGNAYYLTWKSLFVAYLIGDIPSAIRQVRRAIDLDPRDPEPRCVLSLYFFGIEDYRNADHWLDTAIEIAPQNTLARYLSAQYLSVLGDTEAAIEIAEQVLASGAEFRHGALRGVLALQGKKPHADGELEDLYCRLSEPLALFRETGSLASISLVTTPPAFLAVDLAGVLADAGKIQQSRRLTGWVIDNLAPRQYPSFLGFQVVRAEALAIEGRYDEALKSIEDVVATENIAGWQWHLRDNDHFRELKTHPGFLAVLRTISERNAKAREELIR